ncbi:MAG: hypothetical protein HDT26_07095 [Subdoligranulum sp.]|nr:hypothetical protein [Subdoligranulum sp.]
MKPKAKKLFAPAACILLLFLFAVRVYTLNHMYPPVAVQIIPFGETVQSGNLEYTVTNSRWFSSYDEMLDFCAKDEETRALLDSKLQVPYDSKWCIIEFEAANCSDEECRFPFEMNLEKGPWSFGASNPLCLLLNGKDFNAQEVMSVTIAPRSTAAVFCGILSALYSENKTIHRGGMGGRITGGLRYPFAAVSGQNMFGACAGTMIGAP